MKTFLDIVQTVNKAVKVVGAVAIVVAVVNELTADKG